MPFLDVRICEARNLPRVGVFSVKPSPYIIVSCNNANEHRTKIPKIPTQYPQWEEVTRFTFSGSPSVNSIQVSMYDHKGMLGMIDKCLGSFSVNLDAPRFIQGEVDDRWYQCTNSSTGAEVRLRILCHDFGTSPSDATQRLRNSESQQFATLPDHYQSQYVSPPRPQQARVPYELQNSHLYPVAQFNSNNSAYMDHQTNNSSSQQQQNQQQQYQQHRAPALFSSAPTGYSRLSNSDPHNNNTNGSSSPLIAETIQSAPLDFGAIQHSENGGPPVGYRG